MKSRRIKTCFFVMLMVVASFSMLMPFFMVEATGVVFVGEDIDGGIGYYDFGAYPPEDDGDFDLLTDQTREEVGQALSTGIYFALRFYVSFDTSSLPDDADVSSLILSLKTESDHSTTDFEVVIYGDYFQPIWGSELTIADWDCGVDPFDDTWDTVGYADETYINFTIPTTQCNTDGRTQFMVASDREVANTEPADDEYVYFYMGDSDGNEPLLYVEYTTEEPEGGMSSSTLGENWLFANEWHDFKLVYNYVGELSEVKMAFSDLYEANQVTFDGDTDYISVSSDETLNATNLTVSFWVYPKENATGQFYVSRYGRDGWIIQKLSSNRIAFILRDETGDLDQYNSGNDYLVVPNEWNYICCQYNDDDAEVYIWINEEKTTHTGVPHGFENQQCALEIGGEPWIATQYFNGTIDELRVYDAYLSEAEVNYDMTHYEPEEEFTANLKLWMHFDEGEGSTVTDSGIYGNDGSFQNDATWQTGGVILEDPHWVIAKYDLVLDEWSLESGTEIVNIRAGTYTKEDDENVFTFSLYFQDRIFDKLNVNIYTYSSNIDAKIYPWDVFASDWFNIYNLGGLTTLETSGTAGRTFGGDYFNLYASSTNAWAQTNITWRKLQHWRMSFAVDFNLSVPNHPAEDDNYVEFGTYYCINDIWVKGWKVRLNVTDSDNSADASWNEVECTWFRGEDGSWVITHNSYVYLFFEGHSTRTENVLRFWLDIWFNQENSSSIAGGRITSYYYPMWKSGFLGTGGWGRWQGEPTDASHEVRHHSDYFMNLLDAKGNVTTSPQITLMKAFTKVACDYTAYDITIREIGSLDYRFAPNEMQGVPTPEFTDPSMIEESAGGWWGGLIWAISNLGILLTASFNVANFGFWNGLTLFLDTIFSLVGWGNGFSLLMGWIESFLTWMQDAISYMAQMLVSMFIIFGSWLGLAIAQFSDIANGFVVIYNQLLWIWEQGNNGWLAVSDWVTPLLPLLPLALFIWIFAVDSIEGSIKRVKMLWDVFSGIIVFLIHIANFIFGLITGLIEAVTP